jgi:hypothetical protein
MNRVPDNSGKGQTGASPTPPVAPATPDKEPAVAKIGRRFVLEAYGSGWETTILMGAGILLAPFAPDDSLSDPPSVFLYPNLGAEYGGYLCLEYSLDPDRLIAGVSFVIHQDNDQDVEFHVRWPTIEDKASLAAQRLRHRRGLHWSRADATDLADLIDTLVMRSRRSHRRLAA